MDIEWKEGAVCFADGELHYAEKYKGLVKNATGYRSKMSDIVSLGDFQLNTIKQGDYIPKSELDTEDKYNRAVEVFGLFGFYRVGSYSSFILDVHTVMFVNANLSFVAHVESVKTKRKITYDQLMAIGKLKRLMNERNYSRRMADFGCYEISSAKPSSSVSKVNRDIERNQPKNKSKQAYAILESLDYEYDLVKQKWFIKEYIQ